MDVSVHRSLPEQSGRPVVSVVRVYVVMRWCRSEPRDCLDYARSRDLGGSMCGRLMKGGGAMDVDNITVRESKEMALVVIQVESSNRSKRGDGRVRAASTGEREMFDHCPTWVSAIHRTLKVSIKNLNAIAVGKLTCSVNLPPSKLPEVLLRCFDGSGFERERA